jgi:NAD(P)-dependent dehydrogenase (short-subunit alcohol dehydrogenase family)
MSKPITVISGAGSAIAQALVARDDFQSTREIHLLTRGADSQEECSHHQTDYSAHSLQQIAASIKSLGRPVQEILIFNGLLQNDDVRPERALRHFSMAAATYVFHVNYMIPMAILGAFTPLLRGAEQPRILALSARVGSIGDNQLGGWYSYRSSKAALNMGLKCAAIELKRAHPRVKVIAFHPGTTDTPLSKPFQGNVPAEKLFLPEFVAEALLGGLHSAPEGAFSYRDWAGKEIAY